MIQKFSLYIGAAYGKYEDEPIMGD